MTDKQINLKLPDDLWLATKVKAAQNRVSISEAIRVLLREWLSTDTVPPRAETVTKSQQRQRL